jgi:hypothetical protein
MTIRHLKPQGLTDIILAVAHLPSKLSDSDGANRTAECREVSRSLRDVERRLNHNRTVLVGDLNMNPFEDGVVNADCLHGVMTREIADQRVRTVLNREYPLFYNPMWNLFGDLPPGPPGTYYYGKGGCKVYFWNLYDQVLVRPALLERFDSDDVQIITSAGGSPLVTASGRPDKQGASDHLPLFFSLQL